MSIIGLSSCVCIVRSCRCADTRTPVYCCSDMAKRTKLRQEKYSGKSVLKILRRSPCGTDSLDVVVTDEVTYLIVEFTLSYRIRRARGEYLG